MATLLVLAAVAPFLMVQTLRYHHEDIARDAPSLVVGGPTRASSTKTQKKSNPPKPPSTARDHQKTNNDPTSNDNGGGPNGGVAGVPGKRATTTVKSTTTAKARASATAASVTPAIATPSTTTMMPRQQQNDRQDTHAAIAVGLQRQQLHTGKKPRKKLAQMSPRIVPWEDLAIGAIDAGDCAVTEKDEVCVHTCRLFRCVKQRLPVC